MFTSTLLLTEEMISFVKERFSDYLKQHLQLVKVSSPIAVLDGTGINDDLNGVERPVSFPIKSMGERRALVVHSLAKWKRVRLMELGVEDNMGILTDMHALRPDEDYTNLHSIYVDQWDWEKRVSKESRNLSYLKETVESLYKTLKLTELDVYTRYGIEPSLPQNITFIHSQDLLDWYPNLTPKERENMAAKKDGAIFIVGIGGNLSNGAPHDLRAPDYDDWSTLNSDGHYGINGDIIVWHPKLNCAIELSSMGIRVDKEALIRQLELRGCVDRKDLYFHKLLLNNLLPESIGGGIGQSRVCMFMLKRVHVGEVQVGIWSDYHRDQLKSQGVDLL